MQFCKSWVDVINLNYKPLFSFVPGLSRQTMNANLRKADKRYAQGHLKSQGS